MTSTASVLLANPGSSSVCFLDSDDLFDSSYVPNNPSLVLDTALWRSVPVEDTDVGTHSKGIQEVPCQSSEGHGTVDLLALETVPPQSYEHDILLSNSTDTGLGHSFELTNHDYQIPHEILNGSVVTSVVLQADETQFLNSGDILQSVEHPVDSDFTDLAISAFEPFNVDSDQRPHSSQTSDLNLLTNSTPLVTSSPMIHPLTGHPQSALGNGGGHHMADVLLSLKNPIVHPEDAVAWSSIHGSGALPSPNGTGSCLEASHQVHANGSEHHGFTIARQPSPRCGTPSTSSPDDPSTSLSRSAPFAQSVPSSFYDNWGSGNQAAMSVANSFFQSSPITAGAAMSPSNFPYLQDPQAPLEANNPWSIGSGGGPHFMPNQVISSQFSPTQAFFSTSPPPGHAHLSMGGSPYHQSQEFPYYTHREVDESILVEDKEDHEGIYGKSPPYGTRSAFVDNSPGRRGLRSARARNLSASTDLINKHIYGSNTSLEGTLIHPAFGTHPNSPDSSTDTTKNVCGICGKTYARPSTLKTHMRTHSGERPYRCYSCNKSFSQAANLTAHCRTHSGEKPFHCSICNRKFSQSSSVTTHMRTHSGERPYRCRLCKKAFSDSSTLTKHLRIHSGEKPYECKLCHLRFSQSGNLNRHMRIHAQTGR